MAEQLSRHNMSIDFQHEAQIQDLKRRVNVLHNETKVLRTHLAQVRKAAITAAAIPTPEYITTVVGEVTGDALTIADVLVWFKSLYALYSLTPADNVSINWGNSHVQYCILNRATTTFTFGGGYGGQQCILILEQDATGWRSVAFDAGVRGGMSTPIPPTLSGPSKVDYLFFLYNSIDSKYDCTHQSMEY